MHFYGLLFFLVAFATCLSGTSARGAEEKPCQPERWEETIGKFVASDKENPPEQGGVVFVGSSSIRGWKLSKYFPDLPAINRGFGGSEICDSTHYFDDLVAKHQPRVVVFYAGDNDVAGGKNAFQVLADFRSFADKMEKQLPESKLLYIAIKPSIARWKMADTMAEANTLIATVCETEEQWRFVDIWEPMLGDDGKPREELYVKDGLHLSHEGYKLWTELVKPHLEN